MALGDKSFPILPPKILKELSWAFSAKQFKVYFCKRKKPTDKENKLGCLFGKLMVTKEGRIHRTI